MPPASRALRSVYQMACQPPPRLTFFIIVASTPRGMHAKGRRGLSPTSHTIVTHILAHTNPQRKRGWRGVLWSALACDSSWHFFSLALCVGFPSLACRLHFQAGGHRLQWGPSTNPPDTPRRGFPKPEKRMRFATLGWLCLTACLAPAAVAAASSPDLTPLLQALRSVEAEGKGRLGVATSAWAELTEQAGVGDLPTILAGIDGGSSPGGQLAEGRGRYDCRTPFTRKRHPADCRPGSVSQPEATQPAGPTAGLRMDCPRRSSAPIA